MVVPKGVGPGRAQRQRACRRALAREERSAKGRAEGRRTRTSAAPKGVPKGVSFPLTHYRRLFFLPSCLNLQQRRRSNAPGARPGRSAERKAPTWRALFAALAIGLAIGRGDRGRPARSGRRVSTEGEAERRANPQHRQQPGGATLAVARPQAAYSSSRPSDSPLRKPGAGQSFVAA